MGVTIAKEPNQSSDWIKKIEKREDILNWSRLIYLSSILSSQLLFAIKYQPRNLFYFKDAAQEYIIEQ